MSDAVDTGPRGAAPTRGRPHPALQLACRCSSSTVKYSKAVVRSPLGRLSSSRLPAHRSLIAPARPSRDDLVEARRGMVRVRRIVRAIPPASRRPFLAARPAPWAWLRNQGLRLNTGHAELPQLCDAGTQLGGVAVASIDDHQIARKVRLTGPPDLLEGNLWLGLVSLKSPRADTRKAESTR